jgi:hypothetical protein
MPMVPWSRCRTGISAAGSRRSVTAWTVPQPGQAPGLITAQPGVEDLPADPVVPAGHGHVPGDLAGVADDRQPPRGVLVQLSFVHTGLLVIGDPTCQRCPSVLDLRARHISAGQRPVLRCEGRSRRAVEGSSSHNLSQLLGDPMNASQCLPPLVQVIGVRVDVCPLLKAAS